MYNMPICLYRRTQIPWQIKQNTCREQGRCWVHREEVEIEKQFWLQNKNEKEMQGSWENDHWTASYIFHLCLGCAHKHRRILLDREQSRETCPLLTLPFLYAAQEHDAILLPAWRLLQEGQGYPAADGSLSEPAIRRICFLPTSGTFSSDPWNQKEISREVCKGDIYL